MSDDHSASNSNATKPSRTLHDALFKRIFGDVDNAAAELRAVLPPEVTRHIDWPTLALAHANVVSERFIQHCRVDTSWTTYAPRLTTRWQVVICRRTPSSVLVRQ